MWKLSEFRSLSPKQQMAVLEFIRGNSRTYKDIAGKVGVTPRCLYNWRQNLHFKQALEQLTQELKGKVLETSGMLIEINSLSNTLVKDAELVNFSYMGERISKLEEFHREHREILRILVGVLHEIDEKISGIKTLLKGGSHE